MSQLQHAGQQGNGLHVQLRRQSRAARQLQQVAQQAKAGDVGRGALRIERMDDVGAALEALLPVRARTTAEGDLVVSPAARFSGRG